MSSTLASRIDLPLLSAVPTSAPQPAIDYELLLDCVHCGLCTAACPTYVETGNEADSPRGRIYLMRSVIDGVLELDDQVKSHLDLCLNCRACETACPSGVQYGKLIEPFREHLDRLEPGRATQTLNAFQRFLLFYVFPSRFWTRWALAPARFAQWSGLDELLRRSGALQLLPKSLREMHGMLPRLKPHYGELPEFLPAIGKRRARVGLFLGCVADAIYPETNLATAWVLQHNGCDVWIPQHQTCCGALHYHAAQDAPARRYAVQNFEAFGFRERPLADLDAIIVNAAGCGAMLKEYDHLMHGTPEETTAIRFKKKLRDISEFLVELGPIRPTHPLKLRATYHDACHLRHAQQIAKPPRQLLELIPGLELVALPESEICCGAAGSYNLTQPEMATRLGERKTQHIVSTQAQAVFTGNVGCLMQIDRHLRHQCPGIWTAHPIDALWASYSGELPEVLQRSPSV